MPPAALPVCSAPRAPAVRSQMPRVLEKAFTIRHRLIPPGFIVYPPPPPWTDPFLKVPCRPALRLLYSYFRTRAAGPRGYVKNKSRLTGQTAPGGD